MAMTARRLAHIPELGLSLIAGLENADRTINWAHSIELTDPTPYLSGGELVMTTGMNVGQDEASQFDYVARLSGIGVAALAFDTGTTFTEVPPGVVTAADALGLPVLAVPPRTPFIAITRAVIDEVTADQLRSVRRVVKHQEAMVREALRNGIPAVLAALSKALTATVAAISPDGSVLAAAGTDAERVSELGREHLHRTKTVLGTTSRVLPDGTGYCTLQSLRATQTMRGVLAVRTEEPLSPPQRLLVSHAVTLISIELDKPTKVRDAEQRLRVAVTQLLIDEPASVDGAILRYFGFVPEDSILVTELTNVGPALVAERHVQRVLGDSSEPFLMRVSDDKLLLILKADGSVTGRDVMRVLSAQLQRPISGGVSLPGSFADLKLTISQAHIAGRTHLGAELADFADLGVFTVILSNRSDAELRLLAQRLDTLITFDQKHDSSAGGLVASLESYLRHNGHIESAAASLGVHRHTLRNRLAKIGDMTQQDLKMADTRAELWLALKALELLSTNGQSQRSDGPRNFNS